MNELFQQLLLEKKLEEELYKINDYEGAPVVEDALPAVENATATATANEDLAVLLFENFVCVDEFESVVASDVEDGLFVSKFNAIKSDFAYLFDVDSNGTMHTLNHITSIFDINSIEHQEININTSNDEEPHLVSVSSNTTIEEREIHKNPKEKKTSLCFYI